MIDPTTWAAILSALAAHAELETAGGARAIDYSPRAGGREADALSAVEAAHARGTLARGRAADAVLRSLAAGPCEVAVWLTAYARQRPTPEQAVEVLSSRAPIALRDAACRAAARARRARSSCDALRAACRAPRRGARSGWLADAAGARDALPAADALAAQAEAEAAAAEGALRAWAAERLSALADAWTIAVERAEVAA